MGVIRMLVFPVCWDDENIYIYVCVCVCVRVFVCVCVRARARACVVHLLVWLIKYINTIFIVGTLSI
jgi:hypothetical protein